MPEQVKRPNPWRKMMMMTVTQWNQFCFNFVCVIRDLVGNNNNSIANCMVYLARKK